MTEKIYPGGGAVPCAVKTPLVDLLRSMPKTERGIVEHDDFSTSYFPIGQMCHDAADEIDALHQICRDAYEVWAGSEGIPKPETVAEAYLLQLLEQMRDEVKRGLKEKP